MEQVLEEVYTDPKRPGSYGSAGKLLKSLPRNGLYHVTLKKVKDFLKKKDTYTKYRPARKKFSRNQIIATCIDEQWQGDLAEVGNLARANDGVRYLLILIDVVSKHAWVEPLKNKTGPTVKLALEKIFGESGRKPAKLQTDDGKEFLNRDVQGFLKSKGVNFFTVKSDKKAAVAERMVKTLKEKLWRYMHEKSTDRYIDVLQDLVSSYNKTYHSSLKMAPSEVNTGNEGMVLRNLYGKEWMKTSEGLVEKPKAKVGDLVRVSEVKGVFEKGYTGNWTPEIFVIHEVRVCVPHVLYKLKDWNSELIEGSFYDHEIQVVDKDMNGFWKVEKILRSRRYRGRKQHLVKWQGFPSSMNSWVDAHGIKSVGDGVRVQ